jgi:hypothetical protein
MKSDNRLAALTDPTVIERLIGARPHPKAPVAKDFVRAYSDAIKAARENGWTVDQIHDELRCAGVQIEIGTLRKYVNDLCGSIRKRRQRQAGPIGEQLAQPEIPETDGLSLHTAPRSLRRSQAGKV